MQDHMNKWRDTFGDQYAVARPVDNGGLCKITKEEKGKYGFYLKWPNEEDEPLFARVYPVSAQRIDALLKVFGIVDRDWRGVFPSTDWDFKGWPNEK